MLWDLETYFSQIFDSQRVFVGFSERSYFKHKAWRGLATKREQQMKVQVFRVGY